MVEVSFLLFIIACILGFAFSSLFKKIGFTPLIGFVIAGLLLGPMGLHVFQSNEFSLFLELLGVSGVLFFLGLEFDLQAFKENGFFGITFCLVDLGVSLNIGMLATLLFHLNFIEGILTAVILFSSSTLFALKIFADGVFEPKIEKMVKTILALQDIIAIIFLLIIKESVNEGWTYKIGLSIPIIIIFFIIQIILNNLVSKRDYSDAFSIFYSICFGGLIGILTFVFNWPGFLTGFAAGIALNPFRIGKKISKGMWYFKELFLLMFIIGITSRITYLQTPFGLSTLAFIIGMVLITIVFCLLRLYAAYFFSRICGLDAEKGVKTGSILLGIGEFGLIIAMLVTQLKEELFLFTVILIILTEVLTKLALSQSEFLEEAFENLTPKPLKTFFAKIDLSRTNNLDYIHPNEEIKIEKTWLTILLNLTGLLALMYISFLIRPWFLEQNTYMKIGLLIITALISVILIKKIIESWKEIYEISFKGLENKKIAHSILVLEILSGFTMLFYTLFILFFFTYHNYANLKIIFVLTVLLNMFFIIYTLNKIRSYQKHTTL